VARQLGVPSLVFDDAADVRVAPAVVDEHRVVYPAPEAHLEFLHDASGDDISGITRARDAVQAELSKTKSGQPTTRICSVEGVESTRRGELLSPGK
jgi:hypothetical protein